MRTRLLSAALLAAMGAGFAPAVQADHDDPRYGWRSWEERRAQRESERAQRQLRQHQRIAEAERHMGIERPNPTIDTRTQRLPPAPPGHEWQTAPNGDYLLVISSTAQVVQVVQNVTPAGPVAP